MVRPTLTSVRWNSGLALRSLPAGPGEFELYARQLGLTEESYIHSHQLREWCEENRNRCYIPEWLLKRWKMLVKESDV